MARPVAELEALVGQGPPARYLGAVLAAGSLPPLLFSGPPGVGKRTAALLLAQAANCSAREGRPCRECPSCQAIARLKHPDVRLVLPIARSGDDDPGRDDSVIAKTAERAREYALGARQPVLDPRQQITIAHSRWIRREMARPPVSACRRFFIILHADRMNQPAANAILKTLEEPQAQTSFVLTSARPELLLETIRSRCRTVRFSPIPADELQRWLTAEGICSAREAAVAAEIAEGSLGRALRFLDSPDELIVPAVVDYFGLPTASEADIFRAMGALERGSLEDILRTAAFLYRQALRLKHGMPTVYAQLEPSVTAKAEAASTDYLCRVLRYLDGRLDDCRRHLNRRLFLYTLLSSLRRIT